MRLKAIGVALVSSLMMMMSAVGVLAADTASVEINETNFPDEVFRSYVSTNFDSDTDGVLSEEEIARVTNVSVSGRPGKDGGVTSLKGIEYFIGLTGLNCNYNAELTSLDLSKNSALDSLSCVDTSIAKLDLSNNTALTSLNCCDTQITSLDLSNNIKLRVLYCHYTDITSLDLSNNIELATLYCNNTDITSLDLSNNTKLQGLSCELTGIICLDLSNNTELNQLIAYNNVTYIGKVDSEYDLANLKDFDVSKASDWSGATCVDGKLINFTSDFVRFNYDCGNGYKIEAILVARESNVEINETNFPDEVFRSYVSTNFDSDLDGILSKAEIEKVTEIKVQRQQGVVAKSLKGVEFFIKLERLVCLGNSEITSLDVSRNIALKEMWCQNTGITSLVISQCRDLYMLYCNDTKLSSLNLGEVDLKFLYCQNTGITSLDVSKCTSLKEFYCYETGITSLDLSKNTALTTERTKVYDNEFNIGKVGTSYDLSNLPGFDATKASDWTGATYADGKLINFTDTKVTYNYDCGNGHSYTFTLVAELVGDDEPETDGVVDFVNRMYSIILNREPDAGSQTWVDLLKDGTYTGAQVAEGFIMSDEFLNKDISNEEFVKIMYRAFFNREADATGLETWKGCLDEGYIKKFVFAGFANSDEFKALCDTYEISSGGIKLTLAEQTPNLSEQEFNIWQFVERLYSEVLGRDADQVGMDTWVGVLKSGEYTGAQAAEGFIMSDEFLNKDMTNEEFAKIMYRAFFNRDADAVGLETWTNALANGYTKKFVFAGFANSDEFGVLCDAYGITQGSVEAE